MKYKDTLIEIVKHPQHYRNFIGLPFQFDAAEELMTDYWDEISTPIRRLLVKILVKSGKYIA